VIVSVRLVTVSDHVLLNISLIAIVRKMLLKFGLLLTKFGKIRLLFNQICFLLSTNVTSAFVSVTVVRSERRLYCGCTITILESLQLLDGQSPTEVDID